MVSSFRRKYKKTNLFVIDDELWAWAKYRAESLGFRSVSEYLFELIEKDRKGEIDWRELKPSRGLRGLEKLIVEFLEREGGYAKYDELLSYVVGEGYSGKDLHDALNALSANGIVTLLGERIRTVALARKRYPV